MKVSEVLKVDKVRVGALAIQSYIIETFDTDVTASSGNPILSCDLTMTLGHPAVMVTVDLPYYKDAMLMHLYDPETMGETIFGSGLAGYALRESNKPYEVFGKRYTSIPEMLRDAIEIMATEGPLASNGTMRKRKSFGDQFLRAFDVPADVGFHPQTATQLLSSIFKGKHVKVISRGCELDRAKYMIILVWDDKALWVEL